MANAPYFYLRADEELLLAQRPGPGYAFQLFALLALVPLVAGAVVLVALPAWRGVGAASAVGLLALAALFAWRRYATTEYVVTDQRLYARHGKLATSVRFTTHDKVTDLSLRQGPVQRLFGVSTLTFSTAGGDVHMTGVRDAILVKERAEAARDAFIQRLLERAGTDRVPRVVPVVGDAGVVASSAPPLPPLPPWPGPRPDYLKVGDEPAWSQRPLPVSAVGTARSVVGLVPVALWLFFVRGLDAAPIVGVLLGGALLLVAVRLMQLRRTEYMATDRRVYARSGVLGTTVSQLTYDKITDITYQQDLLGRILGYGSVTLSTAGGGNAPIVMRGLRDALDVKEVIERLRDGYLREGA